MTTVTLTPASTSPWTAPAGVTSVQVECWGEGGNGATGSTPASGGGGGGGEYAKETAIAVTPGSNYVFAIGSGGTSTNTVFTGDAQAVTAHFGGNAGSHPAAGSGGSGSTATTHFSGGAGGAGTSATLKGGGGGGSSAGTGSAGGAGGTTSGTAGGAGGTPPTGAGAGGTGGSDVTAGVGGSNPGGGGGGGGDSGSHAGGTGGDGQIVLTYTASTIHSGTATLDGEGTLQGTGAFGGHAVLTGSGTLSWSGKRIFKATVLSGVGTLSGNRVGIISESMTFEGEGTLTGAGTATLFTSAVLSGSGTLSLSGFVLKPVVVLSGSGTLSIIGTGGTVQAAGGPASPYAYPGSSQVAVAPPGTSNWQYLGTAGTVTALTYSFICPGGADKMTCTLMVPAGYRNQLFTPGWQVRITRGGHIVWSGKMDEPVPSAAGWQFTAVGDGNRGQDFRAVYTSTWPAGEPDQAVSAAISRGLPWVNPGIGTPTGIWLGQEQDSGSLTVADLLNLVCSRGGLTWYANSAPGGQPGTDLSVFPLPTAVNRLLVCTQPVARTLGGDINTIIIRYQSADASSSSSGNQQATFATTSVQNAASAAAHGVIETYLDLSGAGTISAGQAQTVGNYILGVYQRASFNGPFTASYGQLLTAGGAVIDPGTDQAGTVVQMILTDFAFGGEVTPQFPVTWITGAYEWDDFAQLATLTPYQMLNTSLSGLLSLESTLLTPITTQQ